MPKRKHRDNEESNIDHKIRRLERKLARARKRKHRSSSSSSCASQDLAQPIAEPIEEPQSVEDQDDACDITPTLEVDNVPELLPPPDPTTDIIDLTDILGKDLTSTSEHGPDIHEELCARLQHVSTSGLEKDTRKELNSKFLVPANCTKIAAPLINDEIRAALPENVIKRDKGIEYRQKQNASAIAGLAEIISSQLDNPNKDSATLKKLMDITKILCDIQYSDSMKRRYFASTALKKDINEHISKTKVDKYLFGENLSETLKSAKAVTKSSSEIKVPQNNKFRKQYQAQPSTSKNWRPPPTNRRLPSGAPRGRQPAPPPPPPPYRAPRVPPPPPPASSSKGSRYQPRQTYRH